MDATQLLASATLKRGHLTAACRAFWRQQKQEHHFRQTALISGVILGMGWPTGMEWSRSTAARLKVLGVGVAGLGLVVA